MTRWPENRVRFTIRIADTDGATGEYGPCSAAVVAIIGDQIAEKIAGFPVGRWRMFEQLEALGRHQSGAHYQLALSAIELALWDLRAKRAGSPAHVLLGGPIRTTIPSYASALGIDIDHPLAKDVVGWLAASGFWGQKWALPGAGRGEPAKLDADRLVRLRDAAGPTARIMIDAKGRWSSGRLQYLTAVLKEIGVEWVEEPTATPDTRPPDLPFPVAAGEHSYDRSDQIRHITEGNLAVWQPDVAWHGGLSRSLLMADTAREFGLESFPHGSSLPAALHLAALTPNVTAVEYHLSLDPLRNFILQRPPGPVGGHFAIPQDPGVAGLYHYLNEETPRHLAGDTHAT